MSDLYTLLSPVNFCSANEYLIKLGGKGLLHPVHQGAAPEGGQGGRDVRDDRQLPGRGEHAPPVGAGVQSHLAEHLPPPVGEGAGAGHQEQDPRGHGAGLQAQVPGQVRQGGEQRQVRPVHEGGRGGLGQDQRED